MALKVNTHPFSKEVKEETLSVRVTSSAKEALQELAASVGISYNRYVAKLIEIHLEELEKEGKLPNMKGGVKKRSS